MSSATDGAGFLRREVALPPGGMNRTICRLGLASRGNTHLTASDVLHAIDRGVNFLNWCGTPNGLSQAIGQLGPRRREVVVCAQFEARTAADADLELAHILAELRTDRIDLLTFYYVEEPGEWEQISGPGGALDWCRLAQRQGKVHALGLTSHQRSLAAQIARGGLLDWLMIRYNAAHRGAEQEVFPVTDARRVPVIVYTCLRWGALLRGTPDDPPGFPVPRAPAWYRFALQSPSATVALMAPDSRAELEEDLTILDDPQPLTEDEHHHLAAHGQRVRAHAGSFP